MVGALGIDGGEDVRGGGDAGFQRDLLSQQPARIALPSSFP